MTNSTISGNSATGDGGGIFSGPLTVTNSTISSNTTTGEGGGIVSGDGTAAMDGALTVINSTISNNTAGGNGGGIVKRMTGDNISNTFTFCTISGNRAASGGAIATELFYPLGNGSPSTYAAISLRNSLVAGNQNNPGLAIAGAFTTEGYNLLQDVSIANIPVPDHLQGTDIMLGASAELSKYLDSNPGRNGGPTETQKLLPVPGNPAIDAIPLTACQVPNSVTNQPIMTDQRGMPRPGTHKNRCDIGAYESSG